MASSGYCWLLLKSADRILNTNELLCFAFINVSHGGRFSAIVVPALPPDGRQNALTMFPLEPIQLKHCFHTDFKRMHEIEEHKHIKINILFYISDSLVNSFMNLYGKHLFVP